jgi:hypothetical protein
MTLARAVPAFRKPVPAAATTAGTDAVTMIGE